MNVARKVAYNTIVQVIGRAVNIALGLVLVRYLTDYLHVTGYGKYSTALAFVGIFSILADFGLNIVVVRELSKRKEKVEEYMGNVLGLRTVVAFLTLALAPLIALFFPYSHDLQLAILVVALGQYFVSLNQVIVGVFQTHLKIDKAVLSDIIGKLVIFILTIYFVKIEAGFLMIMVTFLIGNLVNFLVSLVLVRGIVKPTLRFNWIEWRRIFWEMAPVGIVVVLGMVYIRSDMIILSVIKGSHDVGLYGVAFKFNDLLLVLPAFFMGAVFPLLSAQSGKSEEKLKNIAFRASEVMIIISVPILVLFLILAKHFIALVAPAEFAGATLSLQLLILGIGFAYLAQVPSYVFLAINRQKAIIYVYLALCIENIVLNLIFIPHYSLYGASAITSITELTGFVAIWLLIRKYLKLNFPFIIAGKVIFAGLIMAIAVFIFQGYFLFSILLGGLIYLLILWAMKVIDQPLVNSLLGKE